MMKAIKPSQDDLKALGALLVELMEPDTSPGSIGLKTPAQWSQHVRDFIELSANSTSKTLLQVCA